MRNVLVITNLTLPNLILPKNSDDYIFTYYYLTEEMAIKQIKNSTCRSFFGKKEVLNLFKINQKVQVVEAQQYQVKPYDKILLKDKNNRFIILELVPVKRYYQVLKKIGEVK